MSLPSVSVVIPTFNRKHDLLRAVRSVLAQTFEPLEVIVVDDCSTDGTADEFSAGTLPPEVVYHRLPVNSGPGEARNAGIRLARGRYIGFLDSDDLWDPRRLEKQISALQSVPDPDRSVIYTKGFIKRPHEVIVRPSRAIAADESVADYLFANGGFFGQSSILVPSALTRAVMYDPALRLHEDWDWFMRLQAQGARFVMVDDPLVTYFDDSNVGRASAPQPRRSFEFLEQSKSRISSRAYHALRARFAPQLRDTEPLKGLWYILSATCRGAIGGAYAVGLLGTLTHPELRNIAYRVRGRLSQRHS